MYHKSQYTPKNPQKYTGNLSNIICRSSWERKFYIWCDTNPSIVGWVSEEIVIPYISPLDGKRHRYFVDVKIVVKDESNNTKTYLVEIKPYAQTIQPNEPKRKSPKFLNEVATWYVNSAKWIAAREYCTSRGWQFMLVTEYELGLKKRTK